MSRALLAALVGGLILFVWGAVTHMVLPLGMVGMAPIPAEKDVAVIDLLKSAASENRIYTFPSWDPTSDAPWEQEPFKSRNASGPTGLIVYSPGPGITNMAPSLVRELLTNVLQALAMALVVALLAPGVGYGGRVWVCTLIGIAGSLAIDASYWIWYRFPGDFFVAQTAMNVLGALFAGLAIAKLATPRS